MSNERGAPMAARQVVLEYGALGANTQNSLAAFPERLPEEVVGALKKAGRAQGASSGAAPGRLRGHAYHVEGTEPAHEGRL